MLPAVRRALLYPRAHKALDVLVGARVGARGDSLRGGVGRRAEVEANLLVDVLELQAGLVQLQHLEGHDDGLVVLVREVGDLIVLNDNGLVAGARDDKGRKAAKAPKDKALGALVERADRHFWLNLGGVGRVLF